MWKEIEFTSNWFNLHPQGTKAFRIYGSHILRNWSRFQRRPYESKKRCLSIPCQIHGQDHPFHVMQINSRTFLRVHLIRRSKTIWNWNDCRRIWWVEWSIDILNWSFRYLLLLESYCSRKRWINSQKLFREEICWWFRYWRCNSYCYYDIER